MILPHFHKRGSPEGQINIKDLTPDGDFIAVAPDWAAPEGTEVTYKSGSKVRRYRMVDGSWEFMAMPGVLSGSAVYNPSDLADGAGETTTVTVTGAVLGDFVLASFSLDLQGITLTAYVSATNTVSVRFQNETGGSINLASGTLEARVIPKAEY